MQLTPFLSAVHSKVRHRNHRARVSSLLLLLQRSPLVKLLLPEARIISSTGMTEAVKWCVTAVAGLGAFDSVSGATAVVQLSPTPNSSTVNFVAGEPLTFRYQMTGGGGHTPATFTIFSGTLPAGLTRANTLNSTTDSISGSPAQLGTFPIVLRAWENANGSGRFAEGSFNLIVTAPPLPTITVPPAAVATTEGGLVKLSVTQTSGQSFVWRKDGTPLAAVESVLCPHTASRKWLVPAADPGTLWRTDAAFIDAAWNSCSGGIGYDTSTTIDFNPAIAAGGNTGAGKAFAYVRIPFSLTDPAAISYLKFRFQCDDGYVAWLNGTPISSINAPANPLWNSVATTSRPDATALSWTEITLAKQHTSLLRAGTNLLAVQMLNQAVSSADMLFNCEIAGGIDSVNSPTLVLPALSPADTGAYSVSVNNFTGGTTSTDAPVHILAAVTAHPQSTSIADGQTANLSVTATGSSLAYQWYAGSTGDTSNPVAGATAASFATPPLSTTASYWVRVSNPASHADSNTATVTVDPYPTWQASVFSPAQLLSPAISGPAADPDADGQTNEAEFIFGSLPTSPSAPLQLTSSRDGSDLTLSFPTIPAGTGPGYAGLVRRYTIEYSATLAPGSWQPVPGASDIPATGSTVTRTITPPPAGTRYYYSLRVSLAP